MVLLGKERSTIIRKRKVYGIERVFDERIVLLGKESSTIKIKIDWEKNILFFKGLFDERAFFGEKKPLL